MDNSMWKPLQFAGSPYDAEPLGVQGESVELLVGRQEEALALCTALDSAGQGVVTLAGVPGVGKTSFLNVQQYLLESDLEPFGPHLMAARELCIIRPEDSARDVAHRVVYSLVRSVEEYCAVSNRPVPTQAKTIGKWINAGGGSGYDIGLTLFNCGGTFGRQAEVPKASDVSFEGLRDAVHCLVSEVVTKLGFSGAVIALDNIENLADDQLAKLLISFRDTLFSIPCAWWVLMGQSGLGSLIQALDPRVSERMTGEPLELSPISLDELHAAIDLRVRRFHRNPGGKSPLPQNVHRHLYDASNGEIRFVFKYANAICINIVRDLRTRMMELMRYRRRPRGAPPHREITEQQLNEALGEVVVGEQLTVELAEKHLVAIIATDIKGLHLDAVDRRILQQIGSAGGVTPTDCHQYECESPQEFSSRFLRRFHEKHLLLREQKGESVTYRLRGVALLAGEFGLLANREKN